MENNRNYTIIGMPNAGRTHQTTRLAKLGFVRVDCDERISAAIEPILRNYEGNPTEQLASWLGQPYEVQFARTQGIYLEKETEVMNQVVKMLRGAPATRRHLIDTSDSVIHIPEEVLRELKEVTTFILLDVPDSYQQELYWKFLENPKPLIWGDKFNPQKGDGSLQKTLECCYPELLRWRSAKYRELADITIDCRELWSPHFTTEMLLEKIRQAPQLT